MNEAQALIDKERHQEALSLLNNTLDNDFNDLTALFQIGEILLKTDKLGLAFNIYKYLSTQTNRPEVWNNLGRCLQTKATAKEATKYFKKSLELDTNNAAAMINLAVMDVQEGRHQSAIKRATRALELDPNSRQAMDARAMAKLHLHDWSGWDDYEKGEGPPFRKLKQYRIPFAEREWQGEPGMTVVIYGEQGLGDEILFSSCIQEAIDISKKVVIECDRRLVGMFKRSFPRADVYPAEKVADWPHDYDIDASCPMGRLPKFFRRSTSDFTGDAYLKPCGLRRKAYKAMLEDYPGLKIGVAWTGGKTTDSVTKADSEYRSLSSDQVRSLMSPGNTYVSLQYSNDYEVIDGMVNLPWITQSNDYDDTAALVAELDLIIAVPTTVVHMAGAMGKDVLCITPEHSNWRFSGMLWHNSVKCYRGKNGIKNIRKALEAKYHKQERAAS